MDYNSLVMEEFQHPSEHYKDLYKKIKIFTNLLITNLLMEMRIYIRYTAHTRPLLLSCDFLLSVTLFICYIYIKINFFKFNTNNQFKKKFLYLYNFTFI